MGLHSAWAQYHASLGPLSLSSALTGGGISIRRASSFKRESVGREKGREMKKVSEFNKRVRVGKTLLSSLCVVARASRCRNSRPYAR